MTLQAQQTRDSLFNFVGRSCAWRCNRHSLDRYLGSWVICLHHSADMQLPSSQKDSEGTEQAAFRNLTARCHSCCLRVFRICTHSTYMIVSHHVHVASLRWMNRAVCLDEEAGDDCKAYAQVSKACLNFTYRNASVSIAER